MQQSDLAPGAEPLCTKFKRVPVPPYFRSHVERMVAMVSPGLSPAEMKRAVDKKTIEMSKHLIWLSSSHQVTIDPGQEIVHYSIKRIDKQSILSRDVLLGIAQTFSRERRYICAELYPAESRRVDAANQYHLWRVRRAPIETEELQAALSNPGHPYECSSGPSLLHLSTGSQRDWRAVQEEKNRRFGDETEAVDLMHPETRGRGPLLLVLPSRQQFGFGWTSRGVHYENIASARQRPLAQS